MATEFYVNDDEQQVCFAVEVRVPFHQAAAFADALTGNDDDVILAGETAMRDRIGRLWSAEEVELWPEASTDALAAGLRENATAPYRDWRLHLTGGGQEIVRARSLNEAAAGYMVEKVEPVE